MRTNHSLALAIAGIVLTIIALPLRASEFGSGAESRAKAAGTSALTFSFSTALKNTGVLTGVAGKAKEKFMQFGLKVSGLPPKTDFLLSINVSITQKTTSDSKGALNLKTLPSGSPNALGIHTVALTNNTSGIVVLVITGLGIPPDNTAPT